MNKESSIEIIQLLQQEIDREEKNYELALKEKKEFWHLKEIRNRIHLLKTSVLKLQDKFPGKPNETEKKIN